MDHQPFKDVHMHIFLRIAASRHWFQMDIFVGKQCNWIDVGTFITTALKAEPNESPVKESGTACFREVRSTLSQDGLIKDRFEASHRINQNKKWVDPNTYTSLLQQFVKNKSLMEGKKVHAHIIKTGGEPDIFLKNNLVNLYAKCGTVTDARKIFDQMLERNVVSWNAMIAGYARRGRYDAVLKLFDLMQRVPIKPNKLTFGSVLIACACPATFEQGKAVHAHIIKSGFGSDIIVASNLVDMYVKCMGLEFARQVFDEMPERDMVSWNSVIARYVQIGHGQEALHLFCEMQVAGMKPDQFTFASILGACASLTDLEQGKLFHACIIKSGLEFDVYIGNALVDMYAKCASIDDAYKVFNHMPTRDLVSWNSMIAGCGQNGHDKEAMLLFCQLLQANMKPDPFTFSCILSVCAKLTDLEQGKWVHAFIIHCGLQLNIFSGSALLDMYAKCGSIEDSRKVFDRMPKRDAISWSAIIAAYAQLGYGEEALKLFNWMQQSAMKPDLFNFASSLRACANLASLEQGQQVHAHIMKVGGNFDIVVGCALVDMYAKCGKMEKGHKVFEEMPEQNEISWTAIITGFAQNGQGEDSLKLYREMQLAGMKPDESTFSIALGASACLAALENGKQIHGQILKVRFDSDVFVATSLVDMYAKCGSIEDAHKLFDHISDRNVATWNSMIAGYAQHGHGKDALKLFEQMQRVGMKPNDITFVSVLSACSHVGLMDEGRRYFDSMSQEHAIMPRMEHYACIVDSLGRAGHLEEAENFISKMPFEPGSMIWRTLLGACRIHQNVELGKRAAERVLNFEPQDAATYVLLSNIYAMSGRWDEVSNVRKMMKDIGVKKQPGCSWIEVKNRMHPFFVGDKSHPQTEEIYAELERLIQLLKGAGYVPDTSYMLHDVEHEQKEHSLLHHSEKLAVTFGLMSIPLQMPIRVVKNLRMCGDCHTAIKFICKLVKREIIVRDAIRFHHFKDGLCSCGNYW
eukprot:Gb_10158 [translate_table: standard]